MNGCRNFAELDRCTTGMWHKILLGSPVLFSVHNPKFAISFHSEWKWYIMDSDALLSDRYMAPQRLFTSTIHYSVSTCKFFTGPSHQNSTVILVFTCTFLTLQTYHPVNALRGSPDAQNRVYSMQSANTMLPLPSLFGVVHLATSHDRFRFSVLRVKLLHSTN